MCGEQLNNVHLRSVDKCTSDVVERLKLNHSATPSCEYCEHAEMSDCACGGMSSNSFFLAVMKDRSRSGLCHVCEKGNP